MATRQKQNERPRKRNDTAAVETEQETANRLFLQRVELLPGVLRVEKHKNCISGELSFRVYVREGDRDTEYAIYGIEAEIYQLHPRTYLNVQVLEESEVVAAGADPDMTAR